MAVYQLCQKCGDLLLNQSEYKSEVCAECSKPKLNTDARCESQSNQNNGDNQDG